MDNNGFNTDKLIFTIPKTGYYEIFIPLTISRPTGEYEYVENFNRKWFQFWKPKKVFTEKMEISTIYERRIKLLNIGDVIPCDFLKNKDKIPFRYME